MLTVYRTKSCFKMNLLPATITKNVAKNGKEYDNIERTGSFMVAMANAKEGQDPKKVGYDWENQVTFALSDKDFPALFEAFLIYENSLKLVKGDDDKPKLNGYINASLIHDPNAGTDSKGSMMKTFSMSTMDVNKSLVNVTITYLRKKEVINKVSVSFTVGDMYSFMTFIRNNYISAIGLLN